MKRDVAVILLPKDSSWDDVQRPEGSYVLHVWFKEDTVTVDADGGMLIRNALARAGRMIAKRVDEEASRDEARADA